MNYLTVFVKSEQQDSNVVLILTIFFRLGLNNLITLQILSVILPYHTDGSLFISLYMYFKSILR